MKTPECSGERWQLYRGNCLETMREMASSTIDAIVSDPPYGLEFMGKDWDGAVPGVAYWAEALRVAKPGAYLLAFGGTRTFHRLTVAIEDGGWEIRDCLMWLYGSGFPKSLNLQGERAGWGTALKPSWEPIIMARKPLRRTVAANVEQFGTGAINIKGCRIGSDEITTCNTPGVDKFAHKFGGGLVPKTGNTTHIGRWPSNVMLDPEAAEALDALTGLGESGGASRFFYVAKPSKGERDEGLDGAQVIPAGLRAGGRSEGSAGLVMEGGKANPYAGTSTPARNFHPTVKPVDLMRYLCRLVTPPGGIVLDPFMGSGTTGVAAIREGFAFIGCDKDEDKHGKPLGYITIAARRIAAAPLALSFDAIEEESSSEQSAPQPLPKQETLAL